tara:strand:- start:1483 stop:2355 length:873 start_codon:yes stop_codon:yes gene_type:complete
MSSFLKLLKHKLQIMVWAVSKKTSPLDFYGEAMKSISGRWHGEMATMTTYHALFDVLRQREFSGSLFELGGGYSTILAKTLFDDSQVQITSVDFYPAKYNRILNSKKTSLSFLKTINSINEITVSFEEVEKALEIIVHRLLGYAQDDVRLNLFKFINDSQFCEEFGTYVDTKDVKAICRKIKVHDGFESEVNFYKNFNAMTGKGACAEVAKSGVDVDAVFFDCGEASSLAEFLALECSLKKGSYVLLHDIYFPKSIKNFLLATLLTLDPSWDVLYQDIVSDQGGLVAIKL